jgi:RNA polymerase sigma-70 factor (ECF subfamily)
MDDEQFETLHRAHYADLVRYFSRRGMADLADDLAAEVFVIAWRKIPTGLEAPRPWLFGVARKVLGNARRTHDRKQSLDIHIEAEAQDLRAPKVASHSGAIAIRIDLQRAWNRLSRADQEILALTAWEGLTAAEASEVLHLRRSGAAMRLSRARQRLRELLGSDQPAGMAKSPGRGERMASL